MDLVCRRDPWTDSPIGERKSTLITVRLLKLGHLTKIKYNGPVAFSCLQVIRVCVT